MDKKKLLIPFSALALALSAGGGFVAAAQADTTTSTVSSTASDSTTGQREQRQKPAAIGTVESVSGDTITLTDKMNGTTYTVDASGATIQKRTAPTTAGEKPTETTIAASDVAAGDTLMVQGTVSGTSIAATSIEDGDMPMDGHGFGRGPGVRGTVTAINGSTLTVQGKDGTSYTVDASSATASKMQTISISDVTVGDTVGIDGTVTGTTVTAKSLMDGLPADAPSQTTTTSS